MSQSLDKPCLRLPVLSTQRCLAMLQAEMVGSDVVIAGMVGEQCFAYSYYLTAKEQCNYQGGQVYSLAATLLKRRAAINDLDAKTSCGLPEIEFHLFGEPPSLSTCRRGSQISLTHPVACSISNGSSQLFPQEASQKAMSLRQLVLNRNLLICAECGGVPDLRSAGHAAHKHGQFCAADQLQPRSRQPCDRHIHAPA